MNPQGLLHYSKLFKVFSMTKKGIVSFIHKEIISVALASKNVLCQRKGEHISKASSERNCLEISFEISSNLFLHEMFLDHFEGLRTF